MTEAEAPERTRTTETKTQRSVWIDNELWIWLQSEAKAEDRSTGQQLNACLRWAKGQSESGET